MTFPRQVPTSRPATVVSTVILINNREIARTWQVDSLTVRREVNRISWAKVVLLDGNASSEKFTASNSPLFIPGNEIEIKSGYQQDYITLFKGIITQHGIKSRGANSTLVIECRDKAVRMTIGRKSRTFADMTDSQIMEEISGGYSGISASVQATSVSHRQMVQFNSTDWDFLVTRAEANGKLCYTQDSRLEVKAPALGTTVLKLLYGATILELDAEIDARHQTGEVVARSWNSNDQAISESSGREPTLRPPGNLRTNDLSRTASPGSVDLKHGGNLPEGELNAWSSSQTQKQWLAQVRGRVKCRGTSQVKPGDTIEIGGMSDRFNGKVFVAAVQHFLAAGDWQTDIQFGMEPEWFADRHKVAPSPAAALLPSVNGLQVGVVTDIGDPQGEERIRINLPMVTPSGEGIWARQARPDAGPDRGMLFRPEIGDEVIVGFLDEDPRYPVIIGSVHSSANQAPLPAAGDNPEKGVVTRTGLKLIFDDPEKSVTIETPAGRKFTLNDETGKITLTDGNHSVEITDEGISLNSTGSINISAATELKLEAATLSVAANSSVSLGGSAGVEIESGGVLTLKGSLVKIN